MHVQKKKDLNKKDIEKFDYRKLRLTNHYLYKSEEEQEQNDKKLHKKPPKNPTRDDVKKI